MRLSGLFAFCAVAALAADSPFDGRWLITGKNGGPPRANWVEIKGAGTSSASGSYVSAYNGDRNPINEIKIEGSDLVYVIITPEVKPRTTKQGKDVPGRPSQRLVYRAKLVDGKLDGSTTVEGGSRPPVVWTGVRAPVLPEKDDGSWKPGTPIEVFNGKDLSGWHSLSGEMGWRVEGGILKNNAGVRDLVSDQKFWNFDLHVEYKVGEHSNSGIGLRGRYEIQILEDYGRPPDTHSNGSIYSRVAPPVNASKPAGEWQTYDIRLIGRQVTVKLNGKVLHNKVDIDGLTAMASNADEAEPGPLQLQGDHGPVEFRKITLTPLVKK